MATEKEYFRSKLTMQQVEKFLFFTFPLSRNLVKHFFFISEKRLSMSMTQPSYLRYKHKTVVSPIGVVLEAEENN